MHDFTTTTNSNDFTGTTGSGIPSVFTETVTTTGIFTTEIFTTEIFTTDVSGAEIILNGRNVGGGGAVPTLSPEGQWVFEPPDPKKSAKAELKSALASGLSPEELKEMIDDAITEEVVDS